MDLTIIQKIAIWAIPSLFAISLHEVSHGWVASYFGDQTARLSGRLSFNPIKHIDLFGTILVPLLVLWMTNFQFVFGWAKPVPVDGRNLRNPRRDMAIVAMAGPLMNLFMALCWGAIAKGGSLLMHSGNDWLGIPLIYMGGAGVIVNCVLAVLNLLPLPPLDGSKVLTSLLPPRLAYRWSQLEPYSLIILLILLFTGMLSIIMSPIVFFLISLIGNLFGLSSI